MFGLSRGTSSGRRFRMAPVVATLGVLALAVSACSNATSVDQPSGASQSQTSGSPSSTGAGKTDETSGGQKTLTVDSSFIITSLDPNRALAPTMEIATRGIYDGLLRTYGADATPQPSVATSFDASDDATEYTFHLRDDVVFADGAPLTSADVEFSFNRLANLKLGGSYLMDGLTVSAPDPHTVVLKSAAPNPAIPVIVTTPSFAILNSAMVKAAGGTDAEDAPDKDTADTWFNEHSAGSGPYVLQSYKPDDSITLVRNENYWGKEVPEFDRIVIRNMEAATQLLNVQRGKHEIALDLSAAQSSSLDTSGGLTVKTDPSSAVFRVQMNMDPEASEIASNPHIQEAVRYGINYEAMVQLGGEGAVQAASIIPSIIPGSLPESEGIVQDVDRAKAALAASGIANPELTMTYPSDINVNGLEFATLAQRVAADMEAIGIKLKLEAMPVATYLPEWREGKMPMTITYNMPDFMDASYYSSFIPGFSQDADRAGWKEGTAPELAELGTKINSTVDHDERAKLAQELQRKFQKDSPYIPLMQTAQTVVGTADLDGVVLDLSWNIDVSAVRTK